MKQEDRLAQISLSGVTIVLVGIGIAIFLLRAFELRGREAPSSDKQKQVTISTVPPKKRVVIEGLGNVAKVVIDGQVFVPLFAEEVKAASPSDPRQKFLRDLKDKLNLTGEADVDTLVKTPKTDAALDLHFNRVMGPLLNDGRVMLYDLGSGAFVPFYTISDRSEASGSGSKVEYLLPSGKVFWRM